MLFEIPKNNNGDKSSIENFDTKKYISEIVNNDLSASFGMLKMGVSYEYDTINKWNMHDLLVYCLAQTGTADVYICTWAIKPYPANIISDLKNKNFIKYLHCTLDYRVPRTAPEAYTIIENCSDKINLVRAHAKLTVIENEHWGISITGSANYTQNTRAEVGVLTCNKEIANYRKTWIQKLS